MVNPTLQSNVYKCQLFPLHLTTMHSCILVVSIIHLVKSAKIDKRQEEHCIYFGLILHPYLSQWIFRTTSGEDACYVSYKNMDAISI